MTNFNLLGSSKSNDADDSSALDDEESFKSDKIIDAILDKIWNYAQTYTVKIRKAVCFYLFKKLGERFPRK